MRAPAILTTMPLALLTASCTADRGTQTITSEADITAVSRLMVTLDRVESEADLEELRTLFADDAVLMPPGEPAVLGRRAIADWYRRLYEQFEYDVAREPLDVAVAGDLVLHRGNARVQLTSKQGGAVLPFRYKYMVALRKAGGDSLHIWWMTYNSIEAPATDRSSSP